MTWVQSLRAACFRNGEKLTTTAVLLKAIAIAQKSCPQSRSFIYPFGRIATLEKIVAGFTVERTVDGTDCVFFGSIEEPERKTLLEIMNELIEYKEASVVEHKQLGLETRFAHIPWFIRQICLRAVMMIPALRPFFFAASFGLSSLGKFGADFVTGPCVCTSTFGVGKIEARPVVLDGKIVARQMMTLSLLYDQRCMDGSSAARLLSNVKELLQGGLATHLDPGESTASSKAKVQEKCVV